MQQGFMFTRRHAKLVTKSKVISTTECMITPNALPMVAALLADEHHLAPRMVYELVVLALSGYGPRSLCTVVVDAANLDRKPQAAYDFSNYSRKEIRSFFNAVETSCKNIFACEARLLFLPQPERLSIINDEFHDFWADVPSSAAAYFLTGFVDSAAALCFLREELHVEVAPFIDP
jgi:hypothetical protein